MRTDAGMTRTVGVELITTSLDDVLIAIAREAARGDLDLAGLSFNCDPWVWGEATGDIDPEDGLPEYVSFQGYRLTITAPLKEQA